MRTARRNLKWLSILTAALAAHQALAQGNAVNVELVPPTVTWQATGSPGVYESTPTVLRIRSSPVYWRLTAFATQLTRPSGAPIPPTAVSLLWTPNQVPGSNMLPAGTYNLGQPIILGEGTHLPQYVDAGTLKLRITIDQFTPVTTLAGEIIFQIVGPGNNRPQNVAKIKLTMPVEPFVRVTVQGSMGFTALEPGIYDANVAPKVTVETNRSDVNLSVVLGQLQKAGGGAIPPGQTLLAWGTSVAGAQQAAQNTPFGDNSFHLARPLGSSSFYLFSRIRTTFQDAPGNYQGLVRLEVL